jgi:hypothetical protein
MPMAPKKRILIFVVEDYRGFDASKGLSNNPTIGALGHNSK